MVKGSTEILAYLVPVIIVQKGNPKNITSLNAHVVFDSRTDMPINLPPRHRSIGYVPQDHLLFPFLSVLENVTFGLKGRATMHEVESFVAPIVSLLEIGSLLKMNRAIFKPFDQAIGCLHMTKAKGVNAKPGNTSPREH